MARMPEDVSPLAGRGYGAPGAARPLTELKKNPDKLRATMRIAARARLEGRDWVSVARESGIPYSTLKSWQKNQKSRYALQWFAILEEEAAKAKVTVQGQPIEETRVTTEGFETPEQLADAWSLHATKVQVELMLDQHAARKDRFDAAKRIQDLGGHSPVSRSVVVTAPIEDRKVAAALFAVLQEVRELRASPAPKLIEGEVVDQLDSVPCPSGVDPGPLHARGGGREEGGRDCPD